jgi:plasmid maintenance system killer protein
LIKSFKDQRLEAILERAVPKGMPADLANRIRRKLVMLDAATRLTASAFRLQTVLKP